MQHTKGNPTSDVDLGLFRKEEVKVSELESRWTVGSAEVGIEGIYMGIGVMI